MTYDAPSCAYCPPNVQACRQGESAEQGPGFCPTKVDQPGIDSACAHYDDLKVRHIAQVSAVVESEGYCRWTRVEEACQAHGLQEDRYRPLHQLRRRDPDDEPGQM